MNDRSLEKAVTVGVVLVNWNGTEHTIPCIKSLLKGAVAPDRIVVVDNASVDGSQNLIAKCFPGVELIRNSENLGFTGANNIGIRRLLDEGCDYVWILNNDTTVDAQCLSILRDFMDTHPDAAACSGKILYADPGRLIWYAGAVCSKLTLQCSHRGIGEENLGQYNVIEEVPFISGCCMFVRRVVLEHVGMFDNHFFAYSEDTDWCLRIKSTKMRLYYLPQAVILHELSAAVRKMKGQKTRGTSSPFSIYICSRNRLYIIRKHAANIFQLCTASCGVAALFIYHAAGLLLLGRFEKLGALFMAIYDGIAEPLDTADDRIVTPRYLR